MPPKSKSRVEKSSRKGRSKGTPNKRTVVLREALEAAGMNEDTHPVVQMFKIYMGEIKMPVVLKGGKDESDTVMELELPPDLRVKCMAEVAQYLEPKRKALEVSNAEGEDGEKVPFLLDYTSAPGWLTDPRNPENKEGG